MRPKTIAIAGSGSIAKAHLDAYLELGDLAHVAAIVASDRERGAGLARLTPDARAVSSIDEVLGDDAIDAVDVCGHTRVHAEVAQAALHAGKHVLIEKPPGLTLDGFDAIAAAAASSGCVAMVGQTVRFQPVIASIIEAVGAGEIGRVSLVHVSWYVAHVWPRAWRGWQLDPARSGGHLIHNGMHPIDLALKLLGDVPATVFARGWKTYSPDLPTPDSFHLVLQGRNGGLAVLETSYALRPPAEPFRRIVVAGETGTLSHSTSQETELVNPVVANSPSSTQGAMTAEIRAWLRAVRNEIPNPIPLSESRAALKAAIAAQQSCDTGLAVQLAHQAPPAGAR